jgi:hypothetical protein
VWLDFEKFGVGFEKPDRRLFSGLATLLPDAGGVMGKNARARVAKSRLNSQIHARSAPARHRAGAFLENHRRGRPSGHPSQPNGISIMKGFKFPLLASMSWIAVVLALLSWAPTASLAQSSSPAARHIEAYYQQLMPTLRAAGSLSVRQRAQRFGPAITSAFDIGTMTRLAAGPAWSSFSGAQ